MIKNFSYSFSKTWPILLGLLIGLFFISFQIIGFDFLYFPGDLGDSRLCMYLLEHAHKFFAFQLSSYWNAPFLYPEKNIISYSENLIGSAPFYSIFRLIGLDCETSFQWWFIVIAILNYLCCFLFLNDLFQNKYAAIIGAFIFTFSLSLQSQMGHPQMYPRFPIPLAFWMGLKIFRNLNLKHLFLMGLCTVYLLYCSIYLGLLLIFPLALFLLIIIISKYKDFVEKVKNTKWLLLFISTFLINLIILLPLFIPYFLRSLNIGLPYYKTVFPTIPVISSFFYSQAGSLLWESLNKVGYLLPSYWDHQLFPGAFSILSFVFFTIYIIKIYLKKAPFDKPLLLLFFTSIITFIFYLRFYNFSCFIFIHVLPGFVALRSITRIINIELLFFSITSAFVVAKFFIHFKKHQTIFFFIFLLIVLADNYFIDGQYRTAKCISQERVNTLIEKMKNIPKGSIISYEPSPLNFHSFEYQIDAMLASQRLNLKTLNGYTVTSPLGYADFWSNLDEKSRIKWLTYKQYPLNSIYIIK